MEKRKRGSARVAFFTTHPSYFLNVTHFAFKVRYVSVCVLIISLLWQGFSFLSGQAVRKASFCIPIIFLLLQLCIQIFTAHRCVLRFAHLIGKDSHEQNADSMGNEAIMSWFCLHSHLSIQQPVAAERCFLCLGLFLPVLSEDSMFYN